MSTIYKPHALAPEAPLRRRPWWKLLFVLVGLLLVTAIGIVFFPMSTQSKTRYVFIDTDDTPDSVFTKVEEAGRPYSLLPLKALANVWGYDEVRTGRYALMPLHGNLSLLRSLRNGLQSEVKLTLPAARSMDMLAERLGEVLMVDAKAWKEVFRNEKLLSQYGVTPATLPTLFLPNTYGVYWNIAPEKLLARMQKEQERFWTTERREKAKKAGFSLAEIVTIASIVEQETAYAPEKSAVAGMYINRLRKGMKLQADPTVKFALGNFELRRILHEHLLVDNPYNTYRYEGLPPGPIGAPSVESIEAVLNYAPHDYLFMCAKEDFSGSHRFATTYEEHLKNATRYVAALNERGIQ